MVCVRGVRTCAASGCARHPVAHGKRVRAACGCAGCGCAWREVRGCTACGCATCGYPRTVLCAVRVRAGARLECVRGCDMRAWAGARSADMCGVHLGRVHVCNVRVWRLVAHSAGGHSGNAWHVPARHVPASHLRVQFADGRSAGAVRLLAKRTGARSGVRVDTHAGTDARADAQ